MATHKHINTIKVCDRSIKSIQRTRWSARANGKPPQDLS